MLLHRNKVLPRCVFFWGSFKWNEIVFFFLSICGEDAGEKFVRFWDYTSIFKDDTLFIGQT
jgi:hypothetical protein